MMGGKAMRITRAPSHQEALFCFLTSSPMPCIITLPVQLFTVTSFFAARESTARSASSRTK